MHVVWVGLKSLCKQTSAIAGWSYAFFSSKFVGSIFLDDFNQHFPRSSFYKMHLK